LIVEDEFILALDLQDLVEAAGAAVIGPAPTVEKALQLAKSERLSCAILDVQVNGESVFPVAGWLSEKGIHFLFHTGHGDAQALREEWPGSEVLIKPAQYDQLLSLLVEMTKRGSNGRIKGA
jgi:DNA-binding NtrC family response regulator